MENTLNHLIKESLKSKQPTLSAFVNLKDEDHSFKKLKSLLNKAQNQLASAGKKIDLLDTILADGAVSGKELNLNLGLGDANVAIYITEKNIYSFHAHREFNDEFKIANSPYILPIITPDLAGIKVITLMRKFCKVLEFTPEGLKVVGGRFPVLDEAQLAGFEENASEDRSKKRREEIVRRYVAQTLTQATKSHLDPKDKVLIVAKEEFLAPVKRWMEESPWKRSHVVEKHNFSHFDSKTVEKKIREFVEKNKMNHFKESSGRTEREFHTLNRLKKEVSNGNIQSLVISDARIDRASHQINEDGEGNRELNDFVISLAQKGAPVSSVSQMNDIFSVNVKNIDEGKAFTQA